MNSYWSKVPLDIVHEQLKYLTKVKDIQKFQSDPHINQLSILPNGPFWRYLYQKDFSNNINPNKFNRVRTLMNKYLDDKSYLETTLDFLNIPVSKKLYDLRDSNFSKIRKTFYQDLLKWTIKNNYEKVFKYIDLSHIDGKTLHTQLIKALQNEMDSFVIKRLVEVGARPIGWNGSGYMIIRRKDLDLLDYFIKKGILKDFNILLIYACQASTVPMVDYLIRKGLDIHHNNEEPIKTAIRFGNIPIIKYFLEHGIDKNNDNNVLFKAALNGFSNRCCETIKFLISLGIDIHINDEEILRLAASKNYFELVHFLVKQGANLAKAISMEESKDPNSSTVLFLKRFVNYVI